MFFKKILATLLTFTVSANSVILAQPRSADYLTMDDETFIKETVNRIENYSQFYSNDRIYQFHDQNYRNINSIYDQLLKENPIEQVQTTSNPNKIISNYEYGLLNSDKIYSTNMSEYIKVYKNAVGKVVLPTCGKGQDPIGCVESSKSAEERAVDSYVNPGLTKKKYSYLMGDDVNWFDTLEEAERDYLNKSFYVKEGLFYEYNGKYFNAFNQNDFEKLKNILPNKGLYTDGEHLPSNSESEIKNPLFGETEKFKKQFKEEIRTEFFANIDKIFGNYTPNIKITIDAGINDNLKQSFTNLTSSNNLDADFVSGSNNKIEIIINDELRKTGFDLYSLIKNMKDINSYEKPWITVNRRACLLGIDDNKHDNYDFRYKTSTGDFLNYTIKTQDDGWCHSGFNKVNIGKVDVTYDYDKWLKPNFNIDSPFLQSLNQNNPYLKDMENIDIVKTLNEIYAKTHVNTEKLLENILNKKNPSNWDREVKDHLFEMYYEKCAQKIYGTGFNDLIQEDWIYGSNKQFSVVESQKYYKNNILNSEIISSGDEDEKIDYLTSAGLFSTTWKNWSDNFYYLKNEINNPELNLEKKYYLSNDMEEDLNNYSDLKGDNLGNTVQEARKKQSNREEKLIRTRLFIYNINGELVVSDDDEENAYLDLRKKINLEAKFISKLEASNLRNLESQWSEIISDGVYNVYRFKTKDNLYLYFSSFSNAFSYYEKQYSITSSISEKDEVKYRYVFKMNKREHVFFWSNKSEIKEIALEINMLRKLN